MRFQGSFFTKLLLLWIFLALMVGALLSSMNLFQYRRLADHGLPVTGIVTGLEPKNHQFVDYSYGVSGQMFSGAGNAGRGNPGFALLRWATQSLSGTCPIIRQNLVWAAPMIS
jgi:hypothetical protein